MESKQVVQAKGISVDLYSDNEDLRGLCKNYDYSLSDSDSNTDSEDSVSELKVDCNDNENKKKNTIFNSKDMKIEETDSSEVSDISNDNSKSSDSEDNEDTSCDDNSENTDTSCDDSSEETDMSEDSESEEMSINENIMAKNMNKKVNNGDESDSSEESDSDGSDSSEDTDNETEMNVNIINSPNNIEKNNSDTGTDTDTEMDTEMDPEMDPSENNKTGINYPILELTEEEEEDGDARLHPEQLELLEKSEKIREFLKDDFLREIILEIDHAARNNDRNVEGLLDNRKKNDEMFYNFTEEILNIIYGHPKMDF